MAARPKEQAFAAICGLAAGPLVIAPGSSRRWLSPTSSASSTTLRAISEPIPRRARGSRTSSARTCPGCCFSASPSPCGARSQGGPAARIGSGLIALAGVGVFLTGFLTLDCRELDAGCESTSWQADAHVAVAAPALLALVAAPFVLARAFGRLAGWQDLWKPTLALGVGTVIAAIVGSAIGEGLGQFLPVVLWFAWIAVLAIRMLRLASVERGSAAQRQPSAA